MHLSMVIEDEAQCEPFHPKRKTMHHDKILFINQSGAASQIARSQDPVCNKAGRQIKVRGEHLILVSCSLSVVVIQ